MATKIIAHRGASYEAPENTLIAVNLAWQLGADGVEVDVRLTKDAQIVVFHDATTRRYNGHYKQISRCTYAELHNLDVGRFKGDEFSGERIPLLSQVINTIPKGKILVIEVKSGPGIVTHLKKLLDNSNLNHDLVKFISFKRDTIKMLKNKMPEYDALRIYELRQMPLLNRTIPSLKKIHEQIVHDRLDGMDVNIVPALDRSYIAQFISQKLLLYFWTINDPGQARFLMESGVDGITTDRPAWLRNQLISGN